MTFLGTDEGYAEPSVTGQSNPFPNENLYSEPYKRLAENRLAGLANQTLGFKLNMNDVVAAHRGVYTNRQAARNPRLLAAFHPGAGQGYANAALPVSPRAASGTIQDSTGKNIVYAGGILTRVRGTAVNNASSLNIIDIARANELFVQWLTVGDTDLANLTKYVARDTSTTDLLQITRQAATNLRVERVVASVAATERDITIPSTTPVTGNALGLRLSGTSAAVFLNGVKLDEWTLNAAAQALTGTNVGILYTAGNHSFSFFDYMEAWSTTPVNGI